MKNLIASFLRKFSPGLYYYIRYLRAARKMGDEAGQRKKLFQKLVEESRNKKCLQIGAREKKYAPHWTSVDLYDKSDYIDYHFDVHDMAFEDETFDIVVCNAILEHVERPQSAIEELKRVLKTGGQIWVEVPFNQPYHPSPNDYWRVSPEGLKIWMQDFQPISVGFFKINKTPLYNGIYFFGKKL